MLIKGFGDVESKDSSMQTVRGQRTIRPLLLGQDLYIRSRFLTRPLALQNFARLKVPRASFKDNISIKAVESRENSHGAFFSRSVFFLVSLLALDTKTAINLISSSVSSNNTHYILVRFLHTILLSFMREETSSHQGANCRILRRKRPCPRSRI